MLLVWSIVALVRRRRRVVVQAWIADLFSLSLGWAFVLRATINVVSFQTHAGMGRIATTRPMALVAPVSPQKLWLT